MALRHINPNSKTQSGVIVSGKDALKVFSRSQSIFGNGRDYVYFQNYLYTLPNSYTLGNNYTIIVA